MKNFKAIDLCEIALSAALIAIGAFISIPLRPVPITLQTFFVMAVALIFSPKKSALACLLYMIMGLIGLPIFAGGTGGIQSVFSPSFGFIIGFIIASYVMGKVQKGSLEVKRLIFSLIVGEVIIYLVGIPYMVWMLDRVGKLPQELWPFIFGACVLPFVPGDVAKMALTIPIACQVRPQLEKKTVRKTT